MLAIHQIAYIAPWNYRNTFPATLHFHYTYTSMCAKRTHWMFVVTHFVRFLFIHITEQYNFWIIIETIVKKNKQCLNSLYIVLLYMKRFIPRLCIWWQTIIIVKFRHCREYDEYILHINGLLADSKTQFESQFRAHRLLHLLRRRRSEQCTTLYIYTSKKPPAPNKNHVQFT